MPTWWDSLEAVSRFSLAVKWIAALGAIVGATCGVLVLVSTKRVDALREARDSRIRHEATETERELRERLAAAEKRQEDRHVTPEQHQCIIDHFTKNPIPDKGFVIILCVLGDKEGFAFAADLRSALGDAGFRIILTQEQFRDGNPKGLMVTVRDRNSPVRDAMAILDAFRNCGIKASSGLAGLAPNKTVVIVGVKE